MATSYLYSNASTTALLPFTTADTFTFDTEAVSASDLVLGTGAVSGSMTITAGGNTFTISAFTDEKITSRAFTFSDGSKIVIGDDTTTVGGVGTYDGKDNTLEGTPYDDYLDGRSGSGDTVTYAKAESAVTVNLGTIAAQDTGGAGTDKILNIENVIGSNYNDTLTGTNAANTITGGNGIDTLTGLAGNDVYYVTSGDTVTEASGAGTDTIISTADFLLPDNVENLTLSGNALYGVGNALVNTITGNTGANILDGLGGADVLIGLTGNDIYLVGTGDTVTEASNGGTDLILTTITYTASNNVENLRLMGTAANGTGNTLDNIIYANSSDNTLDGSTGTDTLSYQYGATSGVTVSLAVATAQATLGSGSDTISNFENLIGSNYSDILTDLSSTTASSLSGGAGNDTLTSTGGRDTLDGGIGNDTYILTATSTNIDPGLVVNDLSGTADTMQSYVTNSSIEKYSGIDNLTLMAGSSTGYGNAGNNTLTGFSTASTLYGLGGNDSLVGGAGNDTLDGGIGADTITGAAGTDSIIGGESSDYILAGNAADTIILTDTKIEADKVVFTDETTSDTITGFEVADKDVLVFDISDLGLDSETAVNAAIDYTAGAVNVISAANAALLTAGAWQNHIIVDTAANITGLNLRIDTAKIPNGGPVLAVAYNTGDIYYDDNGNFTEAVAGAPVIIGTIGAVSGLTTSNFLIIA